MNNYKLIEMSDEEVGAISYLLKKDSVDFRDDNWSCGCTRYTPGRCECGAMTWLTYYSGKPVGGA
jgi:hypothetical protein